MTTDAHNSLVDAVTLLLAAETRLRWYRTAPDLAVADQIAALCKQPEIEELIVAEVKARDAELREWGDRQSELLDREKVVAP